MEAINTSMKKIHKQLYLNNQDFINKNYKYYDYTPIMFDIMTVF